MTRLREVKLAAAFSIALAINKRKKMKRKCCVKNWVRRRDRQAAYTQLINELQIEDDQQFRNFTRMSAVEVYSLVNKLGPVCKGAVDSRRPRNQGHNKWDLWWTYLDRYRIVRYFVSSLSM
jgi:hypothetical protein